MGYVTVATTAMSIAMALLLSRASAAIAVLLHQRTQHVARHVAAVLTLVTIFFILINAIVTIVYAHDLEKLTYLPFYLFISLVLVVLPLHVATECIYRAAIDADAPRDRFDNALAMKGMAALALGLLGLILYAGIVVYYAQDYMGDFLLVTGFNLAGIVYIILVRRHIDNQTWFVSLAILGSISSLLYLLLQWAVTLELAGTAS